MWVMTGLYAVTHIRGLRLRRRLLHLFLKDHYSLLRVAYLAALAQPATEFRPRPGVDDRAGFDPAAPRLKDSVAGLFELRGAVGVGINRERRARLARRARHHVVQIEAARRPVHFERHAGLGGRFDDSLEIELHRLAASQQSRRRMADDVYVRVGDGVEKPPGHSVLALAESAMHRSHHHIQTRQNLIRVIEPAVGEDVDFGAHQDARLAPASFLPQRLDFFDLPPQPVYVQP